MPRKAKGRGNRGRGRGNNGQDHQQPRPGRSENGTTAIVSDREEKRNLDGEESERTLAETALSTELKSKQETAIPSARSQDERLGPSEIWLRPQTAPFVKPCGNTDKCEETRKSCVASTISEGWLHTICWEANSHINYSFLC